MGLDRRSNQGAVIETNIELQSRAPTPTQFLRCRASGTSWSSASSGPLRRQRRRLFGKPSGNAKTPVTSRFIERERIPFHLHVSHRRNGLRCDERQRQARNPMWQENHTPPRHGRCGSRLEHLPPYPRASINCLPAFRCPSRDAHSTVYALPAKWNAASRQYCCSTTGTDEDVGFAARTDVRPVIQK